MSEREIIARYTALSETERFGLWVATHLRMQKAEAKVGRLTKVLREVRDAVPKICQAQLGRDCNCGAVTHIIDNALMESDEEG